MKVTISLGQIDVIEGEPDKNLAAVRKMTARAASRKSDAIIFPELWSSGFDLAHAERYAAPVDQGIFKQTAELARRFGLHIVGSNLATDGEGRFTNTAVVYSPTGENLGAYEKIHLFGPMGEKRYLAAGMKAVLVELPWCKAGLAICYDLRFPELFSGFGEAGAKLILLPAQWPEPRIEHWHTLIRARAIENQLFVAACNRVGVTGKSRFPGHSLIVDPMGEILVEGGEDEQLLTAEIDLNRVETARSLFDINEDRRLDSYRNF
ncbi:MAG: carbon-nitrogen family hydrolase [Candidatus Promineifilaceae bacterium]